MNATKPHYECHVTLKPERIPEIEEIAKRHKFKTSVLMGDEVMGDAKLLYCTTHDVDLSIWDRMDRLIADLPVPILRKKIEHVIFDERT